MEFQKYTQNFTDAAIAAGYDKSYVVRCITYASKINDKGLPIIYSLNHLSALVGIDKSYILSVAFLQDRYYRKFEIPKRSGGTREIYEPLPNLKDIQKWILDNLLYRVNISPYAKAFVPKKSIKENARFHKNQKMVLKLDVCNFFPSLSTKLVRKFFKECGYSKRVTYYLSRLCTLNGGLPQGAPTSPALSNIFLFEFDTAIANYCKKNNIRYTRYADDLTFSGEFQVNSVIKLVQKELRKLDLRLNSSKTRLMQKYQRQEVTGIVVNQKLQVPRGVRRNLRQVVFYINKYGMENHLTVIDEKKANYTSHLLGITNFILFINPQDKDALYARTILNNYKKIA